MRVGVFSIASVLIERDEQMARTVLRECLVVRAEQIFTHKAIDYTALNDAFDEVPSGEYTPRYSWYFNEDNILTWHKWANGVKP